MSQLYTIFCLVLEEKTAFSVKIEKNETVDELKKLVKRERSDVFADIAFVSLELYRVDIADNKNLVANVNKKMERQPTALRGTHKIANMRVGAPKDKVIHIVVKLSK